MISAKNKLINTKIKTSISIPFAIKTIYSAKGHYLLK